MGDAKELLAKHSLGGLKEKDFVLFESNGHTKIVYARDLADYDFSDLLAGRSKYVRRSAFRGEMFFTGDIYAVSNPQTLKTYFLYGHGENDPGDPKGQDAKLSPTAYSKLAAILKEEINSDWDRLSLQGTNAIPADCQLLIVAGPREGKFLPDELDKIAAYLKQGGRLLALLTDRLRPGTGAGQLGGAPGRASRVVDLDKKYNIDGRNFFYLHLISSSHHRSAGQRKNAHPHGLAAPGLHDREPEQDARRAGSELPGGHQRRRH